MYTLQTFLQNTDGLLWIDILSFNFFPSTFVFFFCLVTLSRTSNTILNRTNESGCQVFMGRALSFSSVVIMLALIFRYLLFIRLRKFSFIPTLLRVFTMHTCWILSNVYSIPITIIVLLFFFFVKMVNYIVMEVYYSSQTPRWRFLFLSQYDSGRDSRLSHMVFAPFLQFCTIIDTS